MEVETWLDVVFVWAIRAEDLAGGTKRRWKQSFERIILSGLWAVLACAQKEELQEQFVVERLGGQIMISYLSNNKCALCIKDPVYGPNVPNMSGSRSDLS